MAISCVDAQIAHWGGCGECTIVVYNRCDVGADAHIGPPTAACVNRADVGIGPYGIVYMMDPFL